MTVLIDSWTWIEYWKGGKAKKKAAEYIESEQDALVSTLNLLEIYTWFTRYYSENTAKEQTDKVESRCYAIPVEKEVAIAAAKLKIKYKLGIADSVVLATAKQFNAKVVTGDPDFKKIDGVLFIGE
jgi:toxin FitB